MMRRWAGTALTMFLFVIFLFTSVCTASREQTGLWRGAESAQKEPFIKVVDHSGQWSELWMRAFNQAAPPVDFEKYVVACVFLGHSADWMYSISIGEPVRRGEAWVIPYGLAEMVLELSKPFKASGQYAMKVLEKKKDVPMRMEEKAIYGGRKN